MFKFQMLPRQTPMRTCLQAESTAGAGQFVDADGETVLVVTFLFNGRATEFQAEFALFALGLVDGERVTGVFPFIEWTRRNGHDEPRFI